MTTVEHHRESAPAPMSWPAHARATLALGVPLVGSQLGAMLLNTTDTVMLGWYGVTELAAGVLATQVFSVFMLFGTGLALAVIPMAAAAEGQGDRRGVRRAVRMGLWAGLGFSAVVMPLLWFTEPLFVALGQEPEVARLGQDYMRIAQFSLFPLIAWLTLRSFLTAIERTRIVFIVTMAGLMLNAALNWAFIFGHWGAPELGVRGAAIATVGTNTLIFTLLALYAGLSARGRPYEVFVRFWRPDWPGFREVFRIGLPIGMMITAESGMFVFATIFMGWLGVVALAAHGIAAQLAALAFMVPLGMAQAATARIGFFHGRGEMADVYRAAWIVMVMCVGFALAGASLFFAMPQTLIALFLDRSQPETALVIAYAVPLVFIAACFQLMDTTQAIGAALLRGLKDTRVPMIIAIFAYWGVGLPLAWLLAFPVGLEGIGVWIGLAAGLGVAAILLNWRFFVLKPAA